MKERKIDRRTFLGLAGVSALAAACAEIPPITPAAKATGEPTKPPTAPATAKPAHSPTVGPTEAPPTATRKPEATAVPTKKIEPTPSPTAALEIGIGLEVGAGGGALQEILGDLSMHKLTINKAGFEALNPGCKLLVPQDASGKELPEQNTFNFSSKDGKYLASLNPTYPKPKDLKGTPVYNPNSQLIEDVDEKEGWRYHIPIAPAAENGALAVYYREGKYYQGVVNSKTGRVVSEKDYWSPWPKEASKAVLAKWGDSLYVVFTDKTGKILESERKKVLDLPKSPEPTATAVPEAWWKRFKFFNYEPYQEKEYQLGERTVRMVVTKGLAERAVDPVKGIEFNTQEIPDARERWGRVLERNIQAAITKQNSKDGKIKVKGAVPIGDGASWQEFRVDPSKPVTIVFSHQNGWRKVSEGSGWQYFPAPDGGLGIQVFNGGKRDVGWLGSLLYAINDLRVAPDQPIGYIPSDRLKEILNIQDRDEILIKRDSTQIPIIKLTLQNVSP